MKIQKFLTWIQDILLNYPDISFITTKIFIQEFYKCLTDKEKERNRLIFQVISEMTLQQISLDSAILHSKINNFEHTLNNIKKDDKIVN